MGSRIFQSTIITITVLFVGLLVWSIVSLVVMPEGSEVVESALSEEMLYSIRLSLITSLLSVAIVMALSVSIGYLLARFQFPGHDVLRTIVDLPMAFPELVLGLCLLLLFGHSILGDALERLGLELIFSKPAIVIAQVFTAAPYAIRVAYSSFRSVSKRYEMVARSLGYGHFGAFWKVVLPMSRGGLFAAAVIAFARCMGCFGTVLILAGGTRMFTETLPITLYLNISYGNLAMAMTSGMILIGISLGAIVIFEMLNREVVL
ncbi:MAG: ABC transporter permease [Synergistales bacterium]|nr:ABC transporter permease [Synergistales bacterium]